MRVVARGYRDGVHNLEVIIDSAIDEWSGRLRACVWAKG